MMSICPQMETSSGDHVEPAAYRQRMRILGITDLSGEVIVALAFAALQPIGRDLSLILAMIIVASGVAGSYVFGVLLPRRYEARYAQTIGPMTS